MDTVILPLSIVHYQSAKKIFHDAFDDYDLPVKDFEESWRKRSVENSYGIFSKVYGELLGFTIVSFHKKNGMNRYLDYLAVDSRFRGNDLGTRLLLHVLNECRSKNQAIHLYPIESERIKAWYKRFGFQETAGNYLNLHWYETRGSKHIQ
jgi:ribosomal protein S18 acetylase RimI-like enzyme